MTQITLYYSEHTNLFYDIYFCNDVITAALHFLATVSDVTLMWGIPILVHHHLNDDFLLDILLCYTNEIFFYIHMYVNFGNIC